MINAVELWCGYCGLDVVVPICAIDHTPGSPALGPNSGCAGEPPVQPEIIFPPCPICCRDRLDDTAANYETALAAFEEDTEPDAHVDGHIDEAKIRRRTRLDEHRRQP